MTAQTLWYVQIFVVISLLEFWVNWDDSIWIVISFVSDFAPLVLDSQLKLALCKYVVAGLSLSPLMVAIARW